MPSNEIYCLDESEVDLVSPGKVVIGTLEAAFAWG
jgi:hypothetical protein